MVQPPQVGKTARNIFRGLPPEFIEFDLAPDQILPAAWEDLDQEIVQHREMLEHRIEKLKMASNGGSVNSK